MLATNGAILLSEMRKSCLACSGMSLSLYFWFTVNMKPIIKDFLTTYLLWLLTFSLTDLANELADENLLLDNPDQRCSMRCRERLFGTIARLYLPRAQIALLCISDFMSGLLRLDACVLFSHAKEAGGDRGPDAHQHVERTWLLEIHAGRDH